MSRRQDNNNFPHQKVIVIVNERSHPSTQKKVLNNSSISPSQKYRNHNDQQDVRIEMPRNWPTRKPGPSHVTMINRDKRIEPGVPPWKRQQRQQKLVERVQPRNRVFQPLGLKKSLPAPEGHTSRSIGIRKPIEASSLDNIIINQRPLKHRLTGGKPERLIELAPVEETSAVPTVPLVRPRPNRAAQNSVETPQEEPSVNRIKRSLLNPILPPGIEKPKEPILPVTDQKGNNKKEELPNVSTVNKPVEQKPPQLVVSSKSASTLEEGSTRTDIIVEKRNDKADPVKEGKDTISNNVVEPASLSDVSTDSIVQKEEMLRVFPPKQTYDPAKMSATERGIMKKDIQRARKRRGSPKRSLSPPQTNSPRTGRSGLHPTDKGAQNEKAPRVFSQKQTYDPTKMTRSKKHRSSPKRSISPLTKSPRIKRPEIRSHQRYEKHLREESRVESYVKKTEKLSMGEKNKKESEKEKATRDQKHEKHPREDRRVESYLKKEVKQPKEERSKGQSKKEDVIAGEIEAKDSERARKRGRSSDRSTSPPQKRPVSFRKPEAHSVQRYGQHPRDDRRIESYAKKVESLTTEVKSKEDRNDKVAPLASTHLPEVLRNLFGKEMIIAYPNEHTYIFCNKYLTPGLSLRGKKFTCPLHYFLWRKARFCNDNEVAYKILQSKDCSQMEQLASSLRCDEREWLSLGWKDMVDANYAKYQQFEKARFYLFQTLDGRLAEANGDEKFWGIGFNIKDKDVNDPHKWRGENVMGKVLMEIRDLLADKKKYAEEVKRAKKDLLVDRRRIRSKEVAK